MPRPLIPLLLLALGPGAPALAKEKVPDRLDRIEAQVGRITDDIGTLERQITPGRGFITERDAVRRFEDYVYLHMIGENELAAEGFFTLVTTASLGDVGLHRDAEWYLAETLYEMGNYATAEARYLVIADDDQHPFRDDGVRRLLELYAVTGQSEAFAALYDEEIVSGKVEPSDMITYSLAKSFYHQDRLEEAVERFQQLGPDSPLYGKAQYFLGTIAVVEGDLDVAMPYFQVAADLDVVTLDDRKVHDLAQLAIARIHYEQDRLAEAATAYSRVSGDSAYLADQLYEQVWTHIKQEQYRAALDGVEIFLLQFPEHEYTAQLKLLEGHLRLEQKEFDAALGKYEQVVTDYTPIRKRFADLAESDAEPRQYFRQILATAEGNASDADGLPAYAVAMMVSDEGLARALGVYREIVHQQGQIEESEALIAELRTVLDSSAGIGGYERLRYEILVDQGLARDAQIELLEAEEEWLRSEGNADVKRALEPVEKEREELVALAGSVSYDTGSRQALEARKEHLDQLRELDEAVVALRSDAESLRSALGEATLSAADEARVRTELDRVERELESQLADVERLREAGPSTDWDVRLAAHEAEVSTSIASLRRQYEALRSDEDEVLAHVDRLHTALESDQGRLGALRSKLTSMEATELGRIRARFEHEVEEVAAQKLDLDDTLDEAEAVSVVLTREGFGRLEDFFAESVLRADMGIVDVYWSRKIDVADQRERMAEEKATLLSDLEQRFELIRQKLGQ